MKSALLAALLVSAAVLAACESSAVKAPATGEERESEQEEESDSAPFMVVVEHTSGRRCGGSLVSLRTALTSASCVSGEDGAVPSELWALVPGAGAVRRVARVALAAGADFTRTDDAWSGAAMDLAVLELEAPFGGGARSRPILMATQPSECAASSTCHVVRALGHTSRLRIVDATLVSGDACAERSPGWPGLRESALCLVGPTLCSSDWGTGVVCDGKLCGVMSRSSRAPDGSTEAGATSEVLEPQDDTCGDTHVAQSVARWRRFLHCAHTLRACGSGGDCALLCSERRLLDTESADSTTMLLATETTSVKTVETSADAERLLVQPPSSMLSKQTESVPHPVRLSSMKAPTRSRPTQASLKLAPQSSPQAPPRPAFEFEPNRPDFKGGPTRTSRVYLKAGEYGDNAAEYGGEEVLLPTSRKTVETIAPAMPTTIVLSGPAGPAGHSAPAGPAGHSAPAGPAGPSAPAGPAGPSAPAGPTGPSVPAGPAGPSAPAAPGAPTARTADMQARVSPVTGRSRAAARPALAAYFLYVLVAITNLMN